MTQAVFGTGAGARTVSCVYDGFGRLKKVNDNGKETEYTYDADGLRSSKSAGGSTERYVYDNGQLVFTLVPAATSVYTSETTTSYIRGLGLIASRTGSTPTYYHYDAHGNVIQTTDANGNLVKNYYYDAFGVEQNADPADTNPFRYCGEQYDTETGNYYLRARYYTPGVGRFTQEDPIRDGLNWYAYCGGNPVGFVDPSGCTSLADAIPLVSGQAQIGVPWLDGTLILFIGLITISNPIGEVDPSTVSQTGPADAISGPAPSSKNYSQGKASGGGKADAGSGVSRSDVLKEYGGAASGGPKRDDDDPDSRRQLKILKGKRAKEVAKALEYDGPEALKRDFVGNNGAQFNIKYDPVTKEIFLEAIVGGKQIATGLLMP